MLGGPLGDTPMDDETIGDVLTISPEQFFDAWRSVFGTLGWTTAADNLDRYRSGEGGVRHYTREEMQAHPAFATSEEANRTRFESQSFTGTTDNNTELNDALRTLGNGETVTIRDGWVKTINDPDRLRQTVISGPSTYVAFGRTSTASSGVFEATRDGDQIRISGEVTHDFNGPEGIERFDFNPGQVGAGEAEKLERSGQAASFGMRYRRSDRMTATVLRDPTTGNLTPQSASWEPVE